MGEALLEKEIEIRISVVPKCREGARIGMKFRSPDRALSCAKFSDLFRHRACLRNYAPLSENVLQAIAALPVHERFFPDGRAAPGAGDEFIDQVIGQSRIAARHLIQNPIEGEFGIGVAAFAPDEKGSCLLPCALSDNENPSLI
jgi:hypothetical protein